MEKVVLDTVQDFEREFEFKVPQSGVAEEPATSVPPPVDEIAYAPVPDATFRFEPEREELTKPLVYPFVCNGERYTKYTLRRLSNDQAADVGHQLRETNDERVMLSAVSGLPVEAISKMDPDDGEVLELSAVPFMPASWRVAYLVGQPDTST